MNWLLVVGGAMVGAPLRYFTDVLLKARFGSAFPWGTFAVNVVGSFVLALVVGLAPDDLRLLLGTGLCGALTTYSTFSYEALNLLESGEGGKSALYVGGSLAGGVAAAFAGAGIAEWFS